MTSRAQPWNSATVAGSRTVERVEQVVRDAAALGGRQLGGADVHAAVDLHRVGVDDLAAEPLGEVEGQPGLARRGGADDGDDRGPWSRGAGHVASVATRRGHSGSARPQERTWASSTTPRTSSATRSTATATRSATGIDKAADFADDKTGGKYDDKIDTGADKVKDGLDSLDGKDDDIAVTSSDATPADARPLRGRPRVVRLPAAATASRARRCCCSCAQSTGYMDDHWAAAAAGHVEKGETAYDAARREAARGDRRRRPRRWSS